MGVWRRCDKPAVFATLVVGGHWGATGGCNWIPPPPEQSTPVKTDSRASASRDSDSDGGFDYTAPVALKQRPHLGRLTGLPVVSTAADLDTLPSALRGDSEFAISLSFAPVCL